MWEKLSPDRYQFVTFEGDYSRMLSLGRPGPVCQCWLSVFELERGSMRNSGVVCLTDKQRLEHCMSMDCEISSFSEAYELTS